MVAIADVSHYVRYGSVLDQEARGRATSVYFPDRVIPMLPERLSNHLCSLMPQVERLAFVCDMRVSKTGKLSRSSFYEAVIRSHARLTYESAWEYLSNPQAAKDTIARDVRASLDALQEIYHALKEARDRNAAALVVAHRTNFMSIADALLVIRDGKIHTPPLGASVLLGGDLGYNRI